MKQRLMLALPLAIAPIISFWPQPASAHLDWSKPASTQLTIAKQGLTYAELFDLEEKFVDTVVYSMMAADESLIEALFDIRTVRVSSDGQYATVGWYYGEIDAGTTLMQRQGDAIVILAETSGAISQANVEAMGVPSVAAAEIAPY
ncbi:MAG: hypothetical protein AAGC93_17855 [Cyanobacteria bacterium P01_F01_bin.53]